MIWWLNNAPCLENLLITQYIYITHHNRFMALFPGPLRWAGAKRELLDFTVQGKINRGRHTDHLAGRHSIWNNQCPSPPSPIFLQAECPSCSPTNSVKALRTSIPCKRFCSYAAYIRDKCWSPDDDILHGMMLLSNFSLNTNMHM